MRVSILEGVLLALLLVGCGEVQEVTVDYDSEQNRTTYETKSYTVSGTKLGSGLTSSSTKQVTLRAIAQCEGSDCVPQTVRLAFSTKGNAKLSVTGAGGELVADEHRIAWSSVEAGGRPSRGGGRFYEVQGVFATVDVGLDEFEQIATASSVEGSIGGKTLDLGADVRSGFRGLLRAVRGDRSE